MHHPDDSIEPHRQARLGRRGFLLGTGALVATGVLAPQPRTAFAGDSSAGTPYWRPTVHFTPERNWMNDPNGMVHFQGEYHLFFQHNPHGDQWGNMSWGHAVSHDLVHWTELPVALSPDELGAIFSGSAVVDHDNTSGLFDAEPGIVAIYTNAGQTQQQSIAYSTDRGRTWTKYAGNPVIENPGVADFRDPKVFWHDETERWIMSLAEGDRISFYASPDLLNWERLSEFGSDQGAHGGVWECPDLFRLPVEGQPGRSKWVLIVSINPGGPAGGSGMQYFVGEFDGTRFRNDGSPGEVRWVDQGADFYAAVTWAGIPESDGRRLWLGWMSNWTYASEIPTSPWRGSMSVPRELSLIETGAGLRVAQRPVAELERVRRRPRRWSGAVSDGGAAPEFRGSELDMTTEFRLTGASATSFGLEVFTDGEQVTRIGYDVTARQVFVERTESGDTTVSDAFPARHAAEHVPDDGVVRLRILMDRCCVEVFGDRGQVVLTDLVFPAPKGNRVRPFADGGRVHLDSWEIYELNAH
ncbi:fructan beta-fructosidase [Actinopolyspora biskrensis]|uniref:Fructan beta-fructosidase n=1 Tax=Actinopolyspora biskrensis TaxID=1470178 RepID=A0A852Z3B9_9ACTN|nr:glycoside hydrolase family 32 protein [Actinopolyspora biskrensis]NYH80650.1 fructan beta-fructosidase [Actinopolyspora biskrensis]